MKWYDTFANFYDSALEKLYFESRVRAVELLDLQPAQTVLDVACGTGANFSHLFSKEISFKLYGTDFSAGMLKKCQSTVDKNGWKNVSLFQADARDLTPELLNEKTGTADKFDRIICVLGLSVIPDWERVLDQLLELLNEGGRIVIVDVWAEKRTINSWLVEKVARADLDRKIWQGLKEKTNRFQVEYLPVKESKVGGKLFVATGVR